MKPFILTLLSATLLAALQPASSASTGDWQASIAPETAQTELQTLYNGLRAAHYDVFAHRSEDEYDTRFDALYASLKQPLSRFELAIELQKFTAFGNVAHARIDFPGEVYEAFRAAGGRSFPLYLRFVDGHAFIAENYSGVSELSVGDEIISIDGISMTDWLQRTAAHVSADTSYMAGALLEFSFARYLWVELGERDSFQLRLKRDGLISDPLTIPARTRAEMQAVSANAPQVFALDAATREATMLTDEIAYLRPGPFYNFEDPDNVWDPTAFIRFVDTSFETFFSEDAETLIIDLRDNPGGDNSFSDPIIAWIADEPFRFASKFLIRSSDEAATSNQRRLEASNDPTGGVSALLARAFAATPRGETFEFEIPWVQPRHDKRFEGEVYVLVNRHSYSNATTTAAIFQDYGWGIIAGEKTSDMATTYGAMESFTLPETGLVVGFPKAHIIRPSGDPVSDCVTPDLFIPTPIVPSSEDVVLNSLVSVISDM